MIINVYVERLGGCYNITVIDHKQFGKLELRYICTLMDDDGYEDWLNIYEDKNGMYGIYESELREE